MMWFSIFGVILLLICIVNEIVDAKRKKKIAEGIVDLELRIERLSEMAELLKKGDNDV